MGSMIDLSPRELQRKIVDKAMAWLPHDWVPHILRSDLANWATIISRCGFARLDPVFSEKMGCRRSVRWGLGTLCWIDDLLFFVWVDDNGSHYYGFQEWFAWEARHIMGLLAHYVQGAPDFARDEPQALADELVESILKLGKDSVSVRVLGLFGEAVSLR